MVSSDYFFNLLFCFCIEWLNVNSSVPPPASGIVLVAIMNILDTFNDTDTEDDILYQRIVESFKWGYGVRSSLGDPFDEEIFEYIQ